MLDQKKSVSRCINSDVPELQAGDDLAINQLVSKIRNTRDIHEMHELLTELTQTLGFNHFSYITQVPLSPTRHYYFVISAMPKEWTEHYRERHYASMDPVIKYVAESMTASFWDSLPADVEICQEMLTDAEKCGVRYGATAPVYDSGMHGAIFSMARDEPFTEDPKQRQRTLLWLQWIAMQLHQQVHNELLAYSDGIQSPDFTNREKECMTWAAEGKTSWEIGQIIGISEKTVVHHLRGASYKLGSNRRQGAITKAVVCGALQPSWEDGLCSGVAWEGKY